MKINICVIHIANLIFYTNFLKDLIFCLLFNLFHLTVKFAINLIFSHAFGLIFCSLNNYIIFNKGDNMNYRKQTKNIWFFIKNVVFLLEKKKVTSNLIFLARLLVSTWLQIQQKRLKRLNFLRHCLQLYNFFFILSSCYKQRMSEKRKNFFSGYCSEEKKKQRESISECSIIVGDQTVSQPTI